ncbi:MAG: hypothetical protein LBQ60_10785, partial [Bacteroidales bacterium]|nr:hypothetical protein [Bacteroidales bacterium]
DKIKLKSSNISNVPAIEKRINNYPFKKGDILSDAETKVLKSFFNSMNKSKNKVLVIQFYIEQVEKMGIDSFSKERCLSFLTLFRDTYFFIYSDNVGKTISPRMKSGNESSAWGDFWKSFGNGVRDFESCTDKCMAGKLNNVFDGNWIDILEFAAGFPGNLAVWYASCSWDCL